MFPRLLPPEVSSEASAAAADSREKGTDMKNRLTDLNDHLFAQMERLADEDLSPEGIEVEVKRAEAIVRVSDQIVENATLQLEAVAFVADRGDRFAKHLPMLAGPETPKLSAIEGKRA